jgi:cell division protease FtsH
MSFSFSAKKDLLLSFFFIFMKMENTKSKELEIGIKDLVKIGLTAGTVAGVAYGIDKLGEFLKSRKQSKDVFFCANPPFSTEIIGYQETKNKISKLIKKIKNHGNVKQEIYNIVLLLSSELSILLNEIELIKKIPQELTLPFCEIRIDKVEFLNLFLADLKNKLSKGDGVYFVNTSLINNLDNFFLINSIKNIFLNFQKSLLIIYEKKEKFNELKEYFQTITKNILFLGLPDREARLHYLTKFMEKYKITIDSKLSTEYLLKITSSLSFSNLEIICNNILEILNCDSETTTEEKCINKKIFLKAYNSYIQNNNQKEQSFIFGEKKFYPEIIYELSFENIAGYDKTKQELINFTKNIESNKKNTSVGILLWGPPGNGKTLFAKALAGELGLPIFNIKGSDLKGPFVGETERNINNLFLSAENYTSSIIFIDEADSLIPNRNNKEYNHTISVTNEFLSQLNRIGKKNKIIFLIATNRPESLDPALLRPGRIDKKCKIDYPTEEDRRLIINYFIEKNSIEINEEFNVEEISRLLDGFNCAAINNFIEEISELKKINQETIFEIYKKIQKEENIGKFCFEESQTSFNDIGGYIDIKKETQKELIDKLTSPDALEKRIPGCIISGPPGTGKTLLGEAIAKEANVPFIKITTTKLLEEYPYGIEKLFQAIQKNRPCVVIFDEAEQIFVSREKANNAQKDIITDFLEKTGSKNSLTGVCFIGITNYPELIDKAITRPGRLHKQYMLDYPEIQDRLDIINLYLKKFEIEADKTISLKKIAERTNGMLPAEIEHLLEIAKELITEENKEKLNDQILAESYQQIILGKKKKIALNEKEIRQTAYHEAAHGIITFLLDKKEQGYFHFDFLTIEPRAKALGISFSRHSAEYKSMTKEMILGLISVSLAGKAAQEIIFNQTDAGASDDLLQATKLAEDLLKKYGMNKQLYVEPNSKNSEKEKEDIEQILQIQYNKLKNFFKKHKEILDIIVEEVLIKKIIHEENFAQIIRNYENKIKSELIFVVN